MKRLSLLLVMLVLGTMPAALRAAENPPALKIEAALKIAQDYLKGVSPTDPRYIAGLTLETPTMTGASYWYARWSSAIVGGPKTEIGLRIDMDGSLTKVVSGKGGGGGAPSRTTWGASGPSVPVPGIGSQPFGVRNMH